MKPTQITELFANIRATFVSFFSILMFVALGVGIFLGINWASPALYNAADGLYDEGAFHHVQVTFPYGLTQDDLDKLAAVKGVTDVEAARLAFADCAMGDHTYTLKLQSFGQRIDKPIMVEGTLPETEDEIALKTATAHAMGLSIGDTITLASAQPGASGNAAQLKATAFKVTALVESPEYSSTQSEAYGVSANGATSVDGLAWLNPSAFDDAAYQDGFTTVNVRSEALESLGTFSAEYKEASTELEGRISELGDELAPARYDALHDNAQAQIDEGEAKLAEAEEKIAQGEQAIADGEQQLAEAQSTYEQKRAEAESQLAYAYQLLMSYESQKADGEQLLAQAKELAGEAQQGLAEVDKAKAEAEATYKEARDYKKDLDKQLADGKITQDEYDASLDKYGASLSAKLEPYAKLVGKPVPVVTHENFNQALDDARAALDDFENVSITINGETVTVREAREMVAQLVAAIDDAQKMFDEKVAQLNDGWNKYYAGQQELAEKIASYEEQTAAGREKIESVRQQVEEGKQQVAEKKPELESAKEKLAQMKQYSWTVAGRDYNGGVVEASTFGNVTTQLAWSMAALFVIVGLLVSYSAVSRIVHEQITQIGTKKALGLRGREITTSFLAYSALAVVAGAIVGAITGVFVVESIINKTLGGRFLMGPYAPYFDIASTLAVTTAELALVLGATWLACHAILREHAVELLKGEKPPEAKTRFYEKWASWGKLPLLTQTIVNNCMNDKRRVFSTIVGVAGCTALIVTAITLNDDVLASYDAHYEDVYGFDAIAYVDPSVEGSIDAVDAALQDQGATTARVRIQRFSATRPDGSLALMRAVIPADDNTFAALYRVDAVSGDNFDPAGDGAWVSQAYETHVGARVGDALDLGSSDGTTHQVPIAGFQRFYLTYNELVMGRGYYEQAFDTELVPNAILVDTGDSDFESLVAATSEVDGFSDMVNDKQHQKRNFTAFSNVSRTVVLIYLALATLMAIVVLLNLNVMFIEEKKRELIVLMINGFSVKDAKRYIYNDTIVLTFIGIVLGLILGSAMGSITVMAIEPATATFLKGIAWRAILVGTVVTIVLATVMSLIALRRIPAFKLTDINKF